MTMATMTAAERAARVRAKQASDAAAEQAAIDARLAGTAVDADLADLSLTDLAGEAKRLFGADFEHGWVADRDDLERRITGARAQRAIDAHPDPRDLTAD
jgi:hypothetical protein